MLEIKNLSFSYHKNHPTISNISFSLEKGQVGIILGKNGSGKSTLIKNIVGVLKRNQGEILLDNIDLCKISRVERAKKVAYVPQDIIFGSLSVYDSILTGRIAQFGLASSKKDEEKVLEVIKEMNLEDLMYKNVNELSGGERQKVAIARALVQDPELLVFDEPTGNLDIENEHLILKEVKRLAKEKNLTILIAIHDINLAIEYGDHFLLLKEGQLKHEGDSSIISEETIKEIFNINTIIKEIDNKQIVLVKGE